MLSLETWANGFGALAILFTLWLGLRLYRHHKGVGIKEPIVETTKEPIVDTGTLILVILATFGLSAAFNTIKEANRSSARQYISDNSSAVAEMESSTPAVLCIYEWGPATRSLSRTGCGDDIFANNGQLADTFDNIQLYIEESLLFFIEAQQIERRYGPNFYGGFGYWRDDFSRDPTGAISYYILSREVDRTRSLAAVDPQSVACLEWLAQVRIDRICSRYVRFMDRLNIPVSEEERRSCPRLDDLHRYRAQAGEAQCARTWWVTRFAEGYGNVP